MKTTLRLGIAALLVMAPLFVVALWTGASHADSYYDKVFGYGVKAEKQDTVKASYTKKTCGGREPSGESSYFFGFKREWDKMCMTGEFIANDEEEALKCAKDACQNCDKIEDMTGVMSQYKTTPFAFKGQVMKEYCVKQE